MRQAQTQWKATAPLPPAIREEIRDWIASLLCNSPVPMCAMESDADPDITLVVDACEFGWGCVSTTGTGTQYHAGQWSAEDHSKHNLFSSVASEPLGAWRAIMRVVSCTNKKVVVFTDHQPLMFAMNRGIAHAESYNVLLCKLMDNFPSTRFEFRFIAGVNNVVADGLSRGKILEGDREEKRAVGKVELMQ